MKCSYIKIKQDVANCQWQSTGN